MSCDRTNLIEPYFDNELAPQARHAFEAHLRDCADCRKALAELEGLSSLLTSVPLADLPAGAIERLENVWSKRWDRGVLRIAGWFTAAAAAVLIAMVVNWPASKPGQIAQTNDVLESVALMPPADARAENRPETSQLAQWMVDDLSPTDGTGLQ